MTSSPSSPVPRRLDAPVLFLDYDGVLHPDAVYRTKRGIVLRTEGASLFEWVSLLRPALDEAPSVEVVLSTSWGRALGHRQALAWLPGWLQSRVVGGCWHRRYAAEDGWLHVWHTFSRYEQVRHYVLRRSVQDWLALDNDDDGWPDDELHRLVKTDEMKGLAEEGKAEELRVRLVALEAAYQARTARGPTG